MGNFYVRVGNRTLKNEEALNLTSEDRKMFLEEAERANQKRLENMRKGLGMEEPQRVTLDVTPEGIAKRQAAIKAEENRIAAETQVIEKDLGSETAGFIEEAEKPVEEKKMRAKKDPKKTASTK